MTQLQLIEGRKRLKLKRLLRRLARASRRVLRTSWRGFVAIGKLVSKSQSQSLQSRQSLLSLLQVPRQMMQLVEISLDGRRAIGQLVGAAAAVAIMLGLRHRR
jgi:hypothetical protein